MTINLYAFTFPKATTELKDYVLVKLGDSHRNVYTRMKEQGKSAAWEKKVVVGTWNNLQKIKRDYELHAILTERGLHWGEGEGEEWFRIPAPENDVSIARNYIDELITSVEGKRVRDKVILRKQQETTINKVMEYIGEQELTATILANLCPRFGKTLWALMLFNRISEKYGNRVMLLPAYWLSVHTSFINELNGFDDFIDIALIDLNDESPESEALSALEMGQRIVIPISLHGDLIAWQDKHSWIRDIPNNDIFMFADEGDFGTHADNQVAKLNYLFTEKV